MEAHVYYFEAPGGVETHRGCFRNVLILQEKFSRLAAAS
jgi:hypothetical protein